ncbi:MAG TPA: radical SAM protein [Symbiobacteriaceae bacterium]|nr:radical SAM protein [Symbiobacteriaceae bacterium]
MPHDGGSAEWTLAQLLSTQVLELIVMPTEACNCRCVYCYETFGHGRMAPATLDGIKALISDRAPLLQRLALSWFGGEPLLAADIVLEVSRHAAKLADIYPALSYRAHMTTNGYLLSAGLLKELTAVGVLDYQITLDGPAAVHDRRRVRRDGRGTFDRIWENLRAMQASPAPLGVTIRVHYEPATAADLPALVDALRSEFGNDPRFTVRFKAVAPLGGPYDQHLSQFGADAGQAFVRAMNQRLYGPDYAESPEAPYICYAARANSLVIRANGEVAKCTVALADPRNHVGRLHEDGTLAWAPGRLAPWLRGVSTLDGDTLSCPLHSLPPEAIS